MKKILDDKEEKSTSILKPTKRQNSISLNFHIVGIGASSGALETLEQFFAKMPKDTGMAFVIIQHLDKNHAGIMPYLLQRITAMKVTEVTDHLQVKPNNVYLMPPNKSISILHGFLHLFEPTELLGLRLPIDVFFRSLADDQQEKSIGIILSGNGTDGSFGVKAIKEKNGIVLVQDPLTSNFNEMPNSAIDAVTVDIIAFAYDLPAKLIAFLKNNPSKTKNLILEDKNKTNLEKIVILLRTQTGHDFSMYKNPTMYRRIERRMVIRQIDKIADYVYFLHENPKELEILFKELLIGVTNFFRDAVVWEKLKEQILPELFNELPNGHVLRVWVTGCSTGEEAYSFAIVFKEAYEKVKQSKNLTLQIFATDINNDAIIIARRGVFNSNIVTNVSSERISKFFTKKEDKYWVNTSIREMLVFAPHDVIKDPPFTKLDFILCRNLLIYFESKLQKRLVNLFYYCLNTGGLMVLGTSENVNSQDVLFTTIDKKLKIYKRSITPMEIDRMNFLSSFSRSTERTQEVITSVKATSNIQTFAERLLLQRFAPASVLINQEGDILYITGRIGKYLEPAAGKAIMNIYAMASEGLRNELLSAVQNVKQNNKPIILRNIKVKNDESTQFVDINIQSTEKQDEFKDTILIVFTDVTALPDSIIIKSKTGKQNSSTRKDESDSDLQRTLEQLECTREEMQTSQEELKSTNEELQSTNEELQSANQELTISKEEMQSLNEELQTVNMTLQSKVVEFMEANNDITNLLNSTDIGTLLLDNELNIRRYTDQLTKLIKLRPSDIGRLFTEMVSDLQYPEIADHAREVLRNLIIKESNVPTHDQRWFKVRIMPYRTLENRINGVVITFIDITLAKKLEADLNKTIDILREHDLLKP